MPTHDLDADFAYTREREADIALEEEALIEEELARQMALQAGSEEAAFPTPEEPQAGEEDTVTALGQGTPEPPPDPQAGEDLSKNPGESEGDYSFRSIATHMRNAPVKAAADAVDNSLFMLSDTMNYLGLPGGEFPKGPDGRELPILGKVFDDAAGKPDTPQEAIPAFLTENVAALYTGLGFLKWAGLFKNATVAGTGLKGLAAGGLIEGLISNSDEENASRMLEDAGAGSDSATVAVLTQNPLVKLLSTDTDDNTFTRIAKTSVEASLSALGLEGVAKVAMFGVRKIRGLRSAEEVMAEVVETTGVKGDPDFIANLNDLANTKAERDLLTGAVDQFDNAAAARGLEADIAAFKGEAPATFREFLNDPFLDNSISFKFKGDEGLARLEPEKYREYLGLKIATKPSQLSQKGSSELDHLLESLDSPPLNDIFVLATDVPDSFEEIARMIPSGLMPPKFQSKMDAFLSRMFAGKKVRVQQGHLGGTHGRWDPIGKTFSMDNMIGVHEDYVIGHEFGHMVYEKLSDTIKADLVKELDPSIQKWVKDKGAQPAYNVEGRPEDELFATEFGKLIAKKRGGQIPVGAGVTDEISPTHKAVISKILGEETPATVPTRTSTGKVDTNPTSAMTPEQEAILNQIETAARAKKLEADKLFAEAEARTIAAAKKSPADGRWLEAARRAADADEPLSKEVSKALASATKRAVKAEPPKKIEIDNFLKVDERDFKAMKDLYAKGDLDEVARVLGRVIDNTNYERITSPDGGVEPLLKAFTSFFGNNPRGGRSALNKLTFADTEEEALGLVQDIVQTHGSSLEAVVAGLDNMMPDLKGLTPKVNAYRMARQAMAEQYLSIARKRGTPEWSNTDRAELLRAGTVLANMSDRLRTLSNEGGRFLGSHRITAKSDTFTATLKSARLARELEAKGIVDMHGGSRNVDKLAELIDMDNSVEGALRLMDSALSGPTLGDMFHANFIGSILSNPRTQARNIGTGLSKLILYEFPIGFIEAAAISLRRQDASAFRAWKGYIEGTMEGARAALGVQGSFRNMSVRNFKGGTIADAWRSGVRQTGGGNTAFLTEQASKYFSSYGPRKGLGAVIRGGASLTRPFSAGTVRVPLLPPSHKFRNGLADWVETRNGIGAKTFDYGARVMQMPLKALAAGDELMAAMNFHATLRRDAIEAVRNEPTKEAAAELMERIIRDTPNVESLAKNVDLSDDTAVSYIKMIDQLNVQAKDSARRGTFTEPSGPYAEWVNKGKFLMPGLRWHAPFINTPTNLVNLAIKEMNPAGQAVQLVNQARKTGIGSEEVAARSARFAAVSTLWTTGYSAIESGRIQGGGPMNFDQREAWLASTGPDGLQNVPYSIRIGNKRYQADILQPLTMPFFLMADLLDVMDRDAKGELAEPIMKEMISLLNEQFKSIPVFEGLMGMGSLMNDPDRYARDFIVSTTAKTVTPLSGLMGQLRKSGVPIPDDLVDHIPDENGIAVLKELVEGRDKLKIQNNEPGAKGWALQLGSTIQAGVPAGFEDAFVPLYNKVLTLLASEELSSTPDRDFYYRIRTTPPTLGPSLFSPFRIGLDDDDPFLPVSNEMSRLGFGINPKRQFGTVKGVKLTPKQADKFHKLFAEPKGKPHIFDLLNSTMFLRDGRPHPSWDNLGDSVPGVVNGGKLEKLQGIVQRREDAALRALRKDDKDLDEVLLRIEANQRKRRTDPQTTLIKARKKAGEDLSTSATFKATRVEDPFDGALNE